jgi:TatD DNase family protein
VLETDAPWLAPQNRRGSCNEPAYIGEVADKLAQVKGLSREEVERATTANALKVFRLEPSAPEAIAYAYKGALYINLTNRCGNECVFCDRNVGSAGNRLAGLNLSLKREPSFDEVAARLVDLGKYSEVVFCGYGEPTLRLDVLLKLIKEVKARGAKTRLNSNGQGSLTHGRDITLELAAAGLDAVSVSLNAPDAPGYLKLCRPRFGQATYRAVKDFILAAKKSIPRVVATAVALPAADLKGSRKVAENELGVEFRERPYFEE